MPLRQRQEVQALPRPPRLGRARLRRAPEPSRQGGAPPPDAEARLLHRDGQLLVLDKPAGLPVHRGPRGGASLEDWLPVLALGKRRAPQPAHRLDTDTAGCLVLGRTKPALAALGALFAAGRVEKTYWAVVRGAPPAPAGEVAAPLAKRSTARDGWRMVVDPEGQPALTAWRVLGEAGGLAWLELRPRTGRTHQLRVHCAHLGCPILGDARYGGGEAAMLHLLARAIALPLDPPVTATAPVPPHMRAALAACGWREAAE
ncbi:RluA family pseudouridine synthase [Siccirubricoccus sp. G192]|uniref:RluA family pseudouridine synthase n=1 Tax=Siccirubricoccus sp. G192 TaxID=2849651 RepID=UPI001C2C0112|nr:RNA pseudouridine synthase [Siccirubricoccus sp. G192]MBV1799221.1 RNA pseudouridine synthase [Siccirubricoccus sp. G192]